jgi:hypothetical protein
MKDRLGKIALALVNSTWNYQDFGQRGFAQGIDEASLVRAVVAVVNTMQRVAKSNGDLFKPPVKGKNGRNGILPLGEEFMTCVKDTRCTYSQLINNFLLHAFNPWFRLFERHTVNLTSYAGMLGDVDIEARNACVRGIRAEARSHVMSMTAQPERTAPA